MRIELQDLSTARLALELPGAQGEERALVVRDAHKLTGALQSAEGRLSLRGVVAEALVLESVAWRTPTVELRTSTEAALSELSAELSYARPAGLESGAMHIASAGPANVSVRARGHRVVGALSARGVALEKYDAARALGSITELVCQELQTVVAGVLVRVARISAARLVAELGSAEHGSRVMGETLSVTRATASGRGVELEIHDLALPRDPTVDLRAGTVCTDVHIGAVDIAIDDLQAFMAPAPGAEDPARAPGRAHALFDVQQLDRLSGKLCADITVDASLPVIGRRVGTHEFRVPIADGVLNYKQLESGLSALEDAVLDIEHKGEYLVLERDIPIVRKRKDLVRWPLATEAERDLARHQSVRLRTLLAPELPPADKGKSDGQLELARVALDHLSLELEAVRAGAETEDGRGAITDLEFSSLTLTGQLCFEPRAENPPAGQLELELHGFSARIRALEVGPYRIDAARVIIAGVDRARLSLSGLSPRALGATLRGVRIEGLRLGPR